MAKNTTKRPEAALEVGKALMQYVKGTLEEMQRSVDLLHQAARDWKEMVSVFPNLGIQCFCSVCLLFYQAANFQMQRTVPSTGEFGTPKRPEAPEEIQTHKDPHVRYDWKTGL